MSLEGPEPGACPDQRPLPSVKEEGSEESLGVGMSSEAVICICEVLSHAWSPSTLMPLGATEHEQPALAEVGTGGRVRMVHWVFSGSSLPPLPVCSPRFSAVADTSLGQTSCGLRACSGTTEETGGGRLWPLEPRCFWEQKGAGGLDSEPVVGASVVCS